MLTFSIGNSLSLPLVEPSGATPPSPALPACVRAYVRVFLFFLWFLWVLLTLSLQGQLSRVSLFLFLVSLSPPLTTKPLSRTSFFSLFPFSHHLVHKSCARGDDLRDLDADRDRSIPSSIFHVGFLVFDGCYVLIFYVGVLFGKC